MKPIRHILLLLFAFLLVAFSASGQGTSIGLRFGLNSAQLRDIDGAKYLPNSLDTYYFGFERESRFLPFMHFGAGLDFYQLGAQGSNGEQIKLSYLALPLTMKVKVGPLYVKGGYTGAMRVHAVEIRGDERLDPPEGKYSRWHAGPTLSAGVQLLVFYFEVRRTWGQEDIVDGYRPRQWQIGGGILF